MGAIQEAVHELVDRLYSIPAARERMGGVSTWSIVAWLQQGRLERTYVGDRVMISESSIRKFLEESKEIAERRRAERRREKPRRRGRGKQASGEPCL